MAYPRIPDELSAILAPLRLDAAFALREGQWMHAAELLDAIYALLLEQQEGRGKRWHKGWELHNGGVARLRMGQANEGLPMIVLAYVEDALSAPKGEEDAIEGLPAARALRQAGVPAEVLGTIKEVARGHKPDNIPLNPLDLVERATGETPAAKALLSILRIRPSWAEEEKRKAEKPPVEKIPLPPEKRCFVGGSFYHGSNIDDIARVVSNEGFQPIVADQFQVGPRGVHHHSLLLLHLCPKAVFEVAQAAGHLMELERCRDYDIKPLLLRNTHADQTADVSEMISSMAGAKIYSYSIIAEDLPPIIGDYLHERGDWAPES